jgi:hypothetical protein
MGSSSAHQVALPQSAPIHPAAAVGKYQQNAGHVVHHFLSRKFPGKCGDECSPHECSQNSFDSSYDFE